MKPSSLLLLHLTVALAGLGCATADQKKVAEVVDQVAKAAASVAGFVENSNKTIQNVNSKVQGREVVVRKGDTLWALAAKAYRGAPEAPQGLGGFLWPLICQQNGLQDCHLIEPGQVLNLLPAAELSSVSDLKMAWALKVAYSSPDAPRK